MEAANDADADLAPGISRSASSSGPPARATLLRDQRGVTPTEAGALVLDKAEDLLHLEQAMKDDIGALSGTIAGEVALSAYRRTVHIRQNSDRILFTRARAREIPDGKCVFATRKTAIPAELGQAGRFGGRAL